MSSNVFNGILRNSFSHDNMTNLGKEQAEGTKSDLSNFETLHCIQPHLPEFEEGLGEFKGDFGDEQKSLNVQEITAQGGFVDYKEESTDISWTEAFQNVAERSKEAFSEMSPIGKVATMMTMTNPVGLNFKAGEVVVEKFTGNKNATYENTDTYNQSTTHENADTYDQSVNNSNSYSQKTTSKKLGAVNSTTKDTETQSTQDTSKSNSQSNSKSKFSERIYGDGTSNTRSLPSVASYSNEHGGFGMEF